MTLEVNAIEAIWVALNLTTLVLTVSALIDAWANRGAVKLLNGRAKELAASGIVRRESFRVIVQTLLLVAVLPALSFPGEAVINPTVLALMAVPVVLLTSSLLDARDRGAMTVQVAADLLLERVSDMARVEKQNDDLATAIAENTEQGAVIIRQGEKAAVTQVTIVHTAEQVDDIHDATVGK